MQRTSGEISLAEMKEIVQCRFAQLDCGNFAVLDELFDPAYKLNFPRSKVLDLDLTKRLYRELYSAFPDLRHEIHDQIAEDDKVVTRWTAYGCHKGEFMGVPATGRSVSFSGLNIYTFAGDKLAASHVNWDLHGLYVSLTEEVERRDAPESFPCLTGIDSCPDFVREDHGGLPRAVPDQG